MKRFIVQRTFKWSRRDSNPKPYRYERFALTNCATRPKYVGHRLTHGDCTSHF